MGKREHFTSARVTNIWSHIILFLITESVHTEQCLKTQINTAGRGMYLLSSACPAFTIETTCYIVSVYLYFTH